MSRYTLITILGPTACGKTALAAALAYDLDTEIISADSRQIYRRMDIGTGKDLDDYIVNGKQIPYHLIDIAEPGYRYNVFEYQRDFIKAYKEIVSRGKLPILCGGTGLYMEAILKGYKLGVTPEDARIYEGCPRIDSLIIGVKIDRELRRQKISQRLLQRLNEGMVDEVAGLLESGVKAEALIRYGLEYKYVTLYLTGQLTYEEMVAQLEIAIHQFAKRQMTWFRGMEERRGFTNIHWIDAQLPLPEKISIVKDYIFRHE